MNDKSKLKVVDGRRLRSERSKQSILDACEHLMQEGNFVPTAQVVSDRAGVPIRTFFRHFPDMESLFHAVDEAMKPEYRRIFQETKSEGSLSERIASLVELHAKAWGQNKAVLKSTKAQFWKYKALQDNYARVNKNLRKDMIMRLPELKDASTEALELVDALISSEMWERLREHQKVSKRKSIQIITHAIELILKNDGEEG